jgi:hypothetical protein
MQIVDMCEYDLLGDANQETHVHLSLHQWSKYTKHPAVREQVLYPNHLIFAIIT